MQKTELKKPSNLEEEVEDLKLKFEQISKLFYHIRKRVRVTTKKRNINKDGIPYNSSFIGITKKAKNPFILTVDNNGKYYVGKKEFHSLSSSAQYVSGVRRSGWTFWRTNDGKTLKEVYKNKWII